MASLPVDEQIVARLRKLTNTQKQQVLEFIGSLENEKTYTARELLRLRPDERERYIALAFQAASSEEFETFEAYTEEDLSD
jgi:hypothetical protein